MPRRKPTVYLPALALSASLLLSGCGGSDTAAGSGTAGNGTAGNGTAADTAGNDSAANSDPDFISIFDVEAETPEDLERVPLTYAGYPREETSASDGLLFSYDNNSLFVTDYTTGQPPAGFPAEDDYTRNTLYRGMGSVTLFTLPVAADGYLYFSDSVVEGEAGDDEQELARFNLETGLPEVLATTTEPPQITVHEGTLYYLADGLLTALDTGTGKQLWQADCDVESAIDVVLAVTENAVGVMHTETFNAFSREDGKQLADRDAETWYMGLAAGPDGFYLAQRTEDTQERFTSASDIYRIDDLQGDEEKIATTRETDEPELMNLHMSVEDGTLLLKSDSELHAVDTETGETLWTAGVRAERFSREVEREIPRVELFAAFDGDLTYLYATGEARDGDAEETNRLLALDTATGEIRAAYDLEADFASYGPEIDGRNLVFLLNNSSDPEYEALILPKVS